MRAADPPTGSARAGAGRAPRSRTGPLAGIRVADFTWVGVGSLATRLLADYGAEVVKVESRERLDLARRLPLYRGEAASTRVDDPLDVDPNRGGAFNNIARNKLSVTLELSTVEGRRLAERLIAASSVVTENFAPGVMERWGLTYERLRELSPAVVFARMSGYGHDGPDARYRSYGPVVQAVSGLSHVSGLPGREPSGWGLSYMDHMAAYYGSAALLLALLHRETTGEGCEIDLSASETGVGLLGPLLLDVEVNGRSTRRPDYPPGNRLEHPDAAPHGVYPCRGTDRWIAIAVFDQDEWDRLRTALGHPGWADAPAFATQPDRFAHQDELDAHLAARTARHEAGELMAELQRHGVRAAAVQDARDLNDHDPQLAARGLFFELDHPVIGPARFEGNPITMSETTPDHWRSAPLLGEDNAHVYGSILGLPPEELDRLHRQGVI